MKENINNIFFDGYYKQIWKDIIPAELTAKEADFIFRYFNLDEKSRVLDLMCGYGRHAIALGKKGARVVAVDNLDEYIQEIEATTRLENLPIITFNSDIIDFIPEGLFDLAICMGNSLCFFDRNDTIRIVKMISEHLKPGGHFFINTWMLAEIIFHDFRERSWSNVGNLKYITESKFFIQPSRIETDSLMLDVDGRTEVKRGIDYIYSIAETDQMLAEANLRLKEIYSIPGRKKFELGDPRAYIVASKI